MDVQEKILHFLKVNGPVLPVKVAKNIGTDLLLASAHLSDLISQRKVKISRMKIGGSPLYFLSGHEDKLFSFAPGNINAKDLEVLEKLKEKKVLREKSLELLAKVALRSLKDFAVPLNVTVNGQKEIFWKWHLASEEEINPQIRAYFPSRLLPSPQKPIPEISDHQDTSSLAGGHSPFSDSRHLSDSSSPSGKPEINNEPGPELRAGPKPELKQRPEQRFEQRPESKPSVASFFPASRPVSELREELKASPKSESKTVPDPDSKKELKAELKTEEQKTLTEEEKPAEKKKPMLRKIKERFISKRRKIVPDQFFPSLESFFNKLEIIVEQKETIRKNAEMDFLVKVPSAVGTITYYCKAKSKKRCDEKDLSSAYMGAQIKKMPLLFLYTETISKKAEEMLESGAFENITVRKIE